MANEEHLAKLRAGVEDWNRWRDERPEIEPDLRVATLEGVNLQGVNLNGVSLQGVNLKQANLQGAKLIRAHLQPHVVQDSYGGRARVQNATLEEANLGGADLSGARLDNVCLIGANLRNSILRGVALNGANLTKANMEGADLSQATLDGTDLTEANLSQARLEGVSFPKAKLPGAKLRGANLRDVHLEGATGVQAKQIAQADVSGATLPGDVHALQGLTAVEETSKSAKKLFLAMLLGCAYASLTIFSTLDAKLITNSSTSPLPIIQTPVPIAGFFYVAPVILLSMFFYFHLYMQRLWHLLSGLPAVFPDGTALDDRAYPWFLNGLVRSHFLRLRMERPPLSRVQAGISVFLAWWSVPFTLVLFWLWYIRVHDSIGTGLHIFYLTVAIFSAARFQRLARNTLRGAIVHPIRFRENWKNRQPYIEILNRSHRFAALLVAVVMLAFFISGQSMNGAPNEPIPRALRHISLRNFVDLTNQEVSVKPPNWYRDRTLMALRDQIEAYRDKAEMMGIREGGIKKDQNWEIIVGARLSYANLNHAQAVGAFLVNADLNMADLRKTNLARANLTGASLDRADLRGGVLAGATLMYTKFSSAILVGVDLRDADLTGADLTGATLMGANLGPQYPEIIYLMGGNRPPIRQRANRGANLTAANLFMANLAGADLSGSILKGANLRGANLSKVKNLTREQVESAIIDDSTILPDYLK